jgi:hypothetical protein
MAIKGRFVAYTQRKYGSSPLCVGAVRHISAGDTPDFVYVFDD